MCWCLDHWSVRARHAHVDDRKSRPPRQARHDVDYVVSNGDPSHYNGIARDVLGAEGTIGFVSADQKTDLAGNSNGPRFENGAIFRA